MLVPYGPPREVAGSAWSIMSKNRDRLRRERPEYPPPTERENLVTIQFDGQGRLFVGGKCTKQRVDGACTEVTLKPGQCTY